ncbi:MAG TPA: class I SAM-dependent methyltransferase [Gammaproteobacteria bacterium]|nr:class I SAM-dependent methyltransferase [Gammaproteobacteria bacterium]
MKQNIIQNAGSFRDPMGHIYESHQRIYRFISEEGRKQYESILSSIDDAVRQGYLVLSQEISKEHWPTNNSNIAYVLEHSLIPYISYPYEWTFYYLKDAALHHLNFQLFLLRRNIVLKDASAYNIQFIGSKPLFIDLLSLAPYHQGNYWVGHHQFCEQFINPLLLRSILGIPHNHWYRGRLEGITTSDINRIIPLHKKINWNIFIHIVLQNRLNNAATQDQDKAIKKAKNQKVFPKLVYEGILIQIKKWIQKLEPKHTGKTSWEKYADIHTYHADELIKKKRFIADFSNKVKPKILLDLGCNTGDYSLLSLEHGTEYVIGFDFDQTALDLAYHRAKQSSKPFLPLYLDASNPSPDQGWFQAERSGFSKRTRPDALIALAFIHHLAITKNVPLSQLVNWLVAIAPQGIIEFIPKGDSTIVKMLALREDIFVDYYQDVFESLLITHAKIVKKETISKSGRILYWYDRNN